MSLTEGYEYYKAGNYQKAAEVFYSILEEEPNNARVWNLLGICLTKLEKYEVALTCFENALNLDSHNDIYLKNKQKCRHKLSQHVLHRVAMQPPQKKETTPVLISSPTKSIISRSKIMYLFVGLLTVYIILGSCGSYSIGSAPEFYNFLTNTGTIILDNKNLFPFLWSNITGYVPGDPCEPYYTYHIIPEIIPHDRTDIDYLDITRTETKITFKNKSVLSYRHMPGECKSGQDGFGEQDIFSRTDMYQNTLMEGDIVIFPINAPDIDFCWINPESTIIRYKGGSYYAHAHISQTRSDNNQKLKLHNRSVPEHIILPVSGNLPFNSRIA